MQLAVQGPRPSMHPEIFSGDHLGELASLRDPEFGVGVGEVSLYGLLGHVEAVRDLPVGAAVGGQPRDPSLARGKGVRAMKACSPRAAASRGELGVRPAGQRAGSAAGGRSSASARRRPKARCPAAETLLPARQGLRSLQQAATARTADSSSRQSSDPPPGPRAMRSRALAAPTCARQQLGLGAHARAVTQKQQCLGGTRRACR